MSGSAPRQYARRRHCFIHGVILALAIGAAGVATSQDLTRNRGIDRGCVSRDSPPGSAPVRAASGRIAVAWFAGQTREYAHGVLGDDIEAIYLHVGFRLGERGKHAYCDLIRAGPDRVFEDLSPRIVKIGNEQTAVMVVASHFHKGARLELYGYPSPGQDLALLATTPYIGRSHRWLAPVGAADLDGDGRIEIAYIDRPHLKKQLRIWRYQGQGLVPVVDIDGLTNHQIGWDYIIGGIRECDGISQIVLVSADWKDVVKVEFNDGVYRKIKLGPYHSGSDLSTYPGCG